MFLTPTFHSFWRERSSRQAVGYAAAALLGALVCWPVDAFVLRHLPDYLVPFHVWRSVLGVTAASFLIRRAALLAERNALLAERVAERTRELRDVLCRLETTREEEQRRIARDVHDQLGQELTAQRLTLAIAEECLDGDPVTARRKLVEMRGLLDQMMGSVRALIANLRPPVLHDLALGQAARRLLRRTQDLSGLRCELSISGDPAAVDTERSTAAFRILQESLNNVTKHARATSVAICIETTASALVLRVRDDGIGPRARAGGGGFGVLGMRERAHALGGDLSLTGPAEGGTELTCRLPLGALPGGGAS